MSTGQQQSRTGDTSSDTRPKQPRTRANAAANVPFNLMGSSSSTDTTPTQSQTDFRSMADAAARIPNVLYLSGTDIDKAYFGGRYIRGRGLWSFFRSHRSCIAASIAVLLSLVAVGLAPLTFINKEDILTTVDALKRDLSNISQLSVTVDALKRDKKDMAIAVDTLKRDLDGISQLTIAFDALKRDLDNERNRTAILEQHLQEMA
uniref:Uncharacterized protein n=1 Tax=Branchiostoma floridae TaxID=7739 RepID=C3ZGV9_BRAFL|eukprot:XP_002592095.1 hypothetical protein BRAFLDRAFT_84964 [Branchiostoma floridae]